MAFHFKQKQLAYQGKKVLEDLNFQINPGEKVAIIGESGAGKSTLLSALREQLPQQVAWCPQQPGLVPMLSCHHNIYMGQLNQHHFFTNLLRLVYPGSEIKADIQKICHSLGLSQQQFCACEQLSGGQKQRTSIGRALYSQKSILIGDEPVSALDEFQAQQVLTLLCDHFSTLVLALHDVALARKYCQRIIALKGGKILFDKKSSQITQNHIDEVYS